MPNQELEHALARIDAMLKRHPRLGWDEVTRELRALIRAKRNFSTKHSAVFSLADQLVKAATPFVACEKGCASCCYLPSLIFEHEAATLAKASGLSMASLPYRPPRTVVSNMHRYFGVPCPFLEEQRCAVYAARPLACRVHMSFRDDSTVCDTRIPEDKRKPNVTYFADVIEVPYQVIVLANNPKEPWGCIHEFFPPTQPL